MTQKYCSEYPHTLRIHRSSGTAVEAWWTSFGLMWQSLFTIWKYSDREVRYPWIARDGLGNREHSDVWYIQLLRQKVRAWQTFLDNLSILSTWRYSDRGVGHGGHPWHTWMFREGVWCMVNIYHWQFSYYYSIRLWIHSLVHISASWS